MDVSNSNSDEKRSRRKRNASDSATQHADAASEAPNERGGALKVMITNSSLKHLELSVTVSPLSNSSSVSPSQNTPLTRAALAKLKQQTPPLNNNASASLVDVKLLPPPAPLSALPQQLFNDEDNGDDEENDNEEACKKLPSPSLLPPPPPPPPKANIPHRVKTLAQIRQEMAELKRRRFGDSDIKREEAKNESTAVKSEEAGEEPGAKRPKKEEQTAAAAVVNVDSYTSNIEKIVHELKLIGNSNGNQEEETRGSLSLSVSELKENKMDAADQVKASTSNINIASLIKQHHQQQVQSLLANNINFLPIVDTSILENGALSSVFDECDAKPELPSIASILLLRSSSFNASKIGENNENLALKQQQVKQLNGPAPISFSNSRYD